MYIFNVLYIYTHIYIERERVLYTIPNWVLIIFLYKSSRLYIIIASLTNSRVGSVMIIIGLAYLYI
jgi:hypothetical protein